MADGRLCVETTPAAVLSRQFLEDSWKLGHVKSGLGSSLQAVVECLKRFSSPISRSSPRSFNFSSRRKLYLSLSNWLMVCVATPPRTTAESISGDIEAVFNANSDCFMKYAGICEAYATCAGLTCWLHKELEHIELSRAKWHIRDSLRCGPLFCVRPLACTTPRPARVTPVSSWVLICFGAAFGDLRALHHQQACDRPWVDLGALQAVRQLYSSQMLMSGAA